MFSIDEHSLKQTKLISAETMFKFSNSEFLTRIFLSKQMYKLLLSLLLIVSLWPCNCVDCSYQTECFFLFFFISDRKYVNMSQKP